MPIYLVVRCKFCQTFQVINKRLSRAKSQSSTHFSNPYWKCKLDGKNQKIHKIYAKSFKPKDCREVIKVLRIELLEAELQAAGTDTDGSGPLVANDDSVTTPNIASLFNYGDSTDSTNSKKSALLFNYGQGEQKEEEEKDPETENTDEKSYNYDFYYYQSRSRSKSKGQSKDGDVSKS